MFDSVHDLRDEVVVLRPPRNADVPAITRICQDPAIQRWTRVPSPYDEQDARTFALFATGALAEGKGAHLLVTPSGGPDEVVWGCVGVQMDGNGSAELGYWVAPDARGRRVATRASRLLATWAFDVLQAPVLRLTAAVDNPASNAVARRVGFRLIGRRRRGLPDRNPDAAPDARVDTYLYDLLPAEVT